MKLVIREIAKIYVNDNILVVHKRYRVKGETLPWASAITWQFSDFLWNADNDRERESEWEWVTCLRSVCRSICRSVVFHWWGWSDLWRVMEVVSGWSLCFAMQQRDKWLLTKWVVHEANSPYSISPTDKQFVEPKEKYNTAEEIGRAHVWTPVT